MALHKEIRFVEDTEDLLYDVTLGPSVLSRDAHGRKFKIVLRTYDKKTHEDKMEVIAYAICHVKEWDAVSKRGNAIEYKGWQVYMSDGFMRGFRGRDDSCTGHILCRYAITERGKSCERFDNTDIVKVKRTMLQRLRKYFRQVDRHQWLFTNFYEWEMGLNNTTMDTEEFFGVTSRPLPHTFADNN